jgi:hypothetical protein
MSNLTEQEIDRLEDRVFGLECDQVRWRSFRDLVESIYTMQMTFGSISESEMIRLKEQLESIKYL